MDIIDLLSNPIVWAFLVWVFSRLFTSKKKEEKSPPQRTPRPEKPANSRPPERSKPKPVITTVEHEARKKKTQTLQTVQEAYEKMKAGAVEKPERIELVETDKRQPHRQAPKEVPFPKVNRNVKQSHLLVDGNKAVQGVIWSEILGAPRAKNPHYTRNRRHSSRINGQ